MKILCDKGLECYLRCNRTKKKNKTTENMLRVARRKINSMNLQLEEAKMVEKKLNQYQIRFFE